MAQTQRVNHQQVFLLSSKPWRENSLWLEVFSREHGRLALLARSARTRGSELRGILVPFVPLSASWFGREELKTLHRAEWLGGWPQPQGRALFSGLYVNELVLRLTAREDPQPELYDALQDVLQTLCRQPNHAGALRRFEWKLLDSLGYAPDLQRDRNGDPVGAGRRYLVRPEEAVMPLDQDDVWTAAEVAVDGGTLLQLRQGKFDSGEGLQQALQITRLLLDFRLPDGIRSRQVLQQLQRFQGTMPGGGAD